MKFEIYEAKDGVRFRLVANNGKIVADSGEAYQSAGNARRAIKSWRENVRNAPITVVKPKEKVDGTE